MLRVYLLQQWFNLSDPGAEDALYESLVLRRFAGVDLGRAPALDESTILIPWSDTNWGRRCWRRSTAIWTTRASALVPP
jgi:IS5 family transposase